MRNESNDEVVGASGDEHGHVASRRRRRRRCDVSGWPSRDWAIPIPKAPVLAAVEVTTGITLSSGGLGIDPDTVTVLCEDGWLRKSRWLVKGGEGCVLENVRQDGICQWQVVLNMDFKVDARSTHG
jgi:hypothetical protein